MKCSWMGLRNNFRVGNLHIIKIIKKELTTRHVSLTESDFDNIAAEWLRFAKQRKERDSKAKELTENINE